MQQPQYVMAPQPPPPEPVSPVYRLFTGALWLALIGGGLGTLFKRYLLPQLKDWLRQQASPVGQSPLRTARPHRILGPTD